MSDGTRTRDRRDHNPELYQLSYAHREGLESSNGLSPVTPAAPVRGSAPECNRNAPQIR